MQHISDEKKSYAEDIKSLCLCRQLRTDPQQRKLFQTQLIRFRCVLAAVKPSSMYPCRVVLSLAVMSGITSLIGRYSQTPTQRSAGTVRPQCNGHVQDLLTDR